MIDDSHHKKMQELAEMIKGFCDANNLRAQCWVQPVLCEEKAGLMIRTPSVEPTDLLDCFAYAIMQDPDLAEALQRVQIRAVAARIFKSIREGVAASEAADPTTTKH